MGRAAASDLAHLTRVLCSTKTRAQETARRLVEAAGLSVQPTHTAGLLPADSTEAWVTRVEDEVEDLILVGHNPFMEDLLSNLCGSSEAFDTATLACLERQEDGRFQLAWIRRPADLG